jgi:branched-chain amino acid aminotransferase
MTEPVVFLNGEFVPASRAHLNIYDLGIVLGATFTEMTRTFAHQPFRLEEHIARLYRSCKYASITLPLSQGEMLERTHELIASNAALLDASEDLGIVHFVTPGENRLYAGSAMGSARLTPTVCIHSFSLPFAAWRHLQTDGAHVVTPATRHIPPQCIDPKTKNRSRLHWHLADQQTRAVDPKAISLLLDLDGNITECAGSNFVIVNGNTVYSPTSRNILGGVSLQTVRELTEKMGLGWVEKDLQIYDVINADEAWLTTTPYCIAPATRINGVLIGDGKPGPLFHEVLHTWSESVGVDIAAQIQNAAEV